MPGRAATAKDSIRPPKPGDSGTPFVSHGILLNYRDGLRAIVLAAATGGGIKWHFACRLAAEQKARNFRRRYGFGRSDAPKRNCAKQREQRAPGQHRSISAAAAASRNQVTGWPSREPICAGHLFTS